MRRSADALEHRQHELLAANENDLAGARALGLASAQLDRLRLTPERLRAAAGGMREVAALQREVGDRAGEAITLGNLASMFKDESPDAAIWFGKQAVNVLQSIRHDNRGLSDELKRSYEKYVEWYHKWLKKDPPPQRFYDYNKY